jgi:NADP-dependent 3-hydroxy acid dehydrogenase YdfG
MGAFEGKVAFVTGASSGIGAALAREFAREGAAVVLAARRMDRLEALARELPRALAVEADVTRDGEVEAAVAKGVAAFGRIDVAVANAGFGVVGPVEELKLEDFRRQFETNVFGVLRTVHATLPELRRTRGRLAILGSAAGWVSPPGASPYSMSKFAVRALAVALGHELAPAGVSVTHVSPGFVESEIRNVDNDGKLRTEASAGSPPRWMIMPTDVAARRIARAIARRRREIVVTGHGKLAVWLERHLPWLVSFLIRRAGVRSRRQPK